MNDLVGFLNRHHLAFLKIPKKFFVRKEATYFLCYIIDSHGFTHSTYLKKVRMLLVPVVWFAELVSTGLWTNQHEAYTWFPSQKFTKSKK